MDLTREQLYGMLWSDGVGKTEKALGLKQPELKKICDEFQIPRPSSNYWTALHLGKTPEKTPLPPSSDNRSIHTEDYLKPRRTKKEKKEPVPPPPVKTPEGKYEPRELPQEEPATVYTVPEKFVAMDPILFDTKQHLREQHFHHSNPWSKKNPYKSSPQKWLTITVSEAQEERAIRVFATIWRAAEAKGYHLRIDAHKGTYYSHCDTYFIVRNHEISVELKEINKRVKTEDSLYGSTQLVESGRLKFVCDRGNHCYSWNHEKVAAQDTDHTRIEDKIEHIIDVLGQIADERDQAEIERIQAEERRKQQEELKRQEEERKRKEAEELAKIEERRREERNLVGNLLFEADRLRTAALIREYADRFEAVMTDRMDGEELQEKLQWMREKADFIDPFIKRKDEWLRVSDINRLLSPEITKTTEERRPSSYGYGQETVTSYWQLKNAWWRR